MKINSLNVGDEVVDFYLVKRSEVRESSQGSKFMDLDLCDSTGEINCKIWNVYDGLEEVCLRGNIVKIKGLVKEFKGKRQISIEKVREATDEEGGIISNYLEVAPVPKEVMYSELMERINTIKNNDIKEILKLRVEAVEEKLLIYPAAKTFHHSFYSGLLYHITSMIKLGDTIGSQYEFIDNDLLCAGIILHDLEKTNEMDGDEFGIKEYSIKGNLLGHITMGVAALEVLKDKHGFDEEIVTLLQHMVLSHHSVPEFGSPVPPLIPEAELLHFIDNIDAKMNIFQKTIKSMEPGNVSENIYELDRRRVYKRSF